METGTTVFHFSIKADPERPLNYSHEYQIVFIEPSDGTHVFGIQLGQCFRHQSLGLDFDGCRGQDLRLQTRRRNCQQRMRIHSKFWTTL